MELPDRPAAPLDIEPEFRAEFDRDLIELTGTLRTVLEQYGLLLTTTTGRSPRPDDQPQTPDRAVATIAKMGDRLAEAGVWEPGTAHRLLAVAIRRLHEAGVQL